MVNGKLGGLGINVREAGNPNLISFGNQKCVLRAFLARFSTSVDTCSAPPSKAAQRGVKTRSAGCCGLRFDSGGVLCPFAASIIASRVPAAGCPQLVGWLTLPCCSFALTSPFVRSGASKKRTKSEGRANQHWTTSEQKLGGVGRTTSNFGTKRFSEPLSRGTASPPLAEKSRGRGQMLSVKC